MDFVVERPRGVGRERTGEQCRSLFAGERGERAHHARRG